MYIYVFPKALIGCNHLFKHGFNVVVVFFTALERKHSTREQIEANTFQIQAAMDPQTSGF